MLIGDEQSRLCVFNQKGVQLQNMSLYTANSTHK